MEPNRDIDHRSSDLDRVSHQMIGRLSALGIALDGDEDPDQIARLAEAVERFEDAVEAAGGDLMVDEPPRGRTAQPDRADFVLPQQAADESIEMYIGQIDQATERIRRS